MGKNVFMADNLTHIKYYLCSTIDDDKSDGGAYYDKKLFISNNYVSYQQNSFELEFYLTYKNSNPHLHNFSAPFFVFVHISYTAQLSRERK
jgi:hypothetical protein